MYAYIYIYQGESHSFLGKRSDIPACSSGTTWFWFLVSSLTFPGLDAF